MQLGIRLHDINTGLAPELQTMEERAKKAREEGFSCVHLAYSKVIKGYTFDAAALTEGLGRYTKRVFEREGLDVAVLGCYLNLAHPDPEKLKEIQSRYYAHLRVASVLGASVVGTETGAPNAEYKMDANTHSKEALETFIRGLAPVVECAEKYGVSMAIEPVWKHIVCTPERARIVLDAIASPNLRIIFDPVNLLCPENAGQRDEIFAKTIELLGDDIAVVHLKDYVPAGNDLKSIAAGTGEMDYTEILRFMKARKPYIQATLENTNNENAESSRLYLQRLYDEL
ncbi:MAG: sugar phosphate isomerase/epimerase family protein [Erysipelotrichaceae bacterium]|nr:sugar phosphate isomerase/epimerase [Solobacterium sp.]MDO5122439.1 sugar phosphate isomerase/epimerase family protein [Erysipelotrichaceae bacterium]